MPGCEPGAPYSYQGEPTAEAPGGSETRVRDSRSFPFSRFDRRSQGPQLGVRRLAIDLMDGKLLAIIFKIIFETCWRGLRLEVQCSITRLTMLVCPFPGIVGGEAKLDGEIYRARSCGLGKTNGKPSTVNLRATVRFNYKLDSG